MFRKNRYPINQSNENTQRKNQITNPGQAQLKKFPNTCIAIQQSKCRKVEKSEKIAPDDRIKLRQKSTLFRKQNSVQTKY